MNTEVWRPVVGYEGMYSVSDQGRIRGDARLVPHMVDGKRLPERILKPRINKATGYPTVNLTRENKRRTFTVHILVAAAFLGPRPFGMEVAHGDGDRTNPRLSNLRYTTKVGNRDDSRRHGTLAMGTRLPQSKLNEAAVMDIRSGGLLREHAERYGVALSTVCRVRNRVDWKHVG